MTATHSSARRGLLVAALSSVLWGVMPLYWHLLRVLPAIQTVAHRIAWSCLFVVGYLTWRRPGWASTAFANPNVRWMLAISGLLIAFNWGLYIWSINAGYLVQSSLGYFMSPLMSVVLGVAFFKERLTRPQCASVTLASIGVMWLSVKYGQPPWIALGGAISYALYGLTRKFAAVEAMSGYGIESAYLFLPSVAVIAWAEMHGVGCFWPTGVQPVLHLKLDALLIVGGTFTALPLIGYGYAVRRAPLSLVGLMQYLSPMLQLAIGVFVFAESFNSAQAVGFALIWCALLIFAAEGLWMNRRDSQKKKV